MAEENKKPIIADPLAGVSTDTDNLSVMSDTQTRKTVKLKPIAKPDEHGRKTVILKNIAGEIDKANVVESAEAAAPVAPEEKPVAAAEVANEDTVKIQRPAIAKKTGGAEEKKVVLPPGTPDEKATIKLTPPQPKAAETAAETVKLTPPKPLAAKKEQAEEAAAAVPSIDYEFQQEPKCKCAGISAMVAISALLLGAAAVVSAMQYFK